MPSIPPSEVQCRIAALQTAMADHDLDGALIVQKVDLFYFSGTGQDAHLFVPTEGPPLLMVRKSYERALDESSLESIYPLKSLSDLRDSVQSALPHPLKSLGMELDVLPVNNFRYYEQLFPSARISDVSPLVRTVRSIKSAYELEQMRAAAVINDAMFGKAREILREGMTELEFGGLLEAFYRQNGHQGVVRVRSFNQEVFYGHIMSGANLAVPSSSVGPTGGPGVHPSLPHGAGLKRIQRHEPVQVDYVGVHNGYLVDQARTFFLGRPPERFLKIHAVALAIQQALMEQGLPGTRAERLYDIAIAMAEAAGLSEGFMGYPHPVPFVGHGVGLELDELPVVGRKSPYILHAGMVVALEPKFILPTEGLAGIENTFVVTPHGLEKITTFDDEIQILA